jgi:hypothetical protein
MRSSSSDVLDEICRLFQALAGITGPRIYDEFSYSDATSPTKVFKHIYGIDERRLRITFSI